jgi:TonB family protein
MMMATIDGQVVVEFTVDRKGAVTAVDILKSGGEDFEKSVKAAAKAWRFYPARNESNGKTISVRMRCTVTFSCPEDDAPNHAPDPTASAVTPAADAPVAPAIGRGSS